MSILLLRRYRHYSKTQEGRDNFCKFYLNKLNGQTLMKMYSSLHGLCGTNETLSFCGGKVGAFVTERENSLSVTLSWSL